MANDDIVDEIATELILDAARDVEFQTVLETLGDRCPDFAYDLTEFDEVARRIHDLISKATVTVELPEDGGS